MPKWTKAKDPSAREIDDYKEKSLTVYIRLL
jgi:hypothetical protein